MNKRSDTLYHGSTRLIQGAMQPALIQATEDHVHEKASVFATARKDLAGLFMLPADALSSIGFERDAAYVCIWGTEEEYRVKDKPGYLYELPLAGFEKVGKGYEWQNFNAVTPSKILTFDSALGGMLELGVKVYFINDEEIFDRIVAEKDNRWDILKDLKAFMS